MPHLDEGMIHELLDGEIPSSALPPITAHLASCAECRARLERAQALMAEADELIETLDLPAVPPATAVTPLPVRRSSPWVTPVAWAASLVLAVALGYAARPSAPLLPLPAAGLEKVLAGGSDTAVAQPPGERAKETLLPPPPTMRRNEPAAKATAPAFADARRDGAEPPANSEATGNRAEVATSQPAAAPVMAVAPPTAGSSAGQVREALSGVASRSNEAERRSLARDMASKQLADNFASRIDSIGLPDAMRLLGGHIRLIEGAIPKRLEAHGTEVRVIYPLSGGELVLSQRLTGGTISWRLLAPSGFPADSLEKLRALVRE